MKSTIFLCAFMMLICHNIIGQKPNVHIDSNSSFKACDCDTDQTVTICYLSIDDYCVGFEFNCEYSLDGNFFSNGLVRKLTNPNNFGASGKVKCSMQIQKLENITGAQSITDQQCDMIFIGNFPMDTLNNGRTNLNKTTIPQPTLNAIKEWSVECPQNLVVLTQAEAQTWGYIVQDQNINPNTPDPLEQNFDAFNGPFGSLTSFNQGGGFQGVFTTLPSTEVRILARDNNNQPTVVLDIATNDIVLGDIGILCSNGAGQVSTGGNVNNSNDIFACNLFSIGCNIASGEKIEKYDYSICPSDTLLLPNGYSINTEGIFIDTFLTTRGCDSIIESTVLFRPVITTLLSYDGCVNDSFKVLVNAQVYDITNPAGTEILQNIYGCDSIVQVDLLFKPTSTSEVGLEVCSKSGDQYQVGSVVFGEDFPSGFSTISASNGCDSVVSVNMVFIPLDTSSTIISVCKGELGEFDGASYESDNQYFIPYQNSKGCDSTVVLRIVDYDNESEFNIPTAIVVDQEKSYVFNNKLPINSTLEWFPKTGLSCYDCPNPIMEKFNTVPKYNLQVIDDFGCLHIFDIDVTYICKPYFPNIFRASNPDQLFKGQILCAFTSYSIQIFDRWGNVVFTSTDINNGWDGLINGTAAQPGVYIYVGKMFINGEEVIVKGDITLVN